MDATQHMELDKGQTVAEIRDAELEIIKSVQKRNFDKEFCSLKQDTKDPIHSLTNME